MVEQITKTMTPALDELSCAMPLPPVTKYLPAGLTVTITNLRLHDCSIANLTVTPVTHAAPTDASESASATNATSNATSDVTSGVPGLNVLVTDFVAKFEADYCWQEVLLSGCGPVEGEVLVGTNAEVELALSAKEGHLALEVPRVRVDANFGAIAFRQGVDGFVMTNLFAASGSIRSVFETITEPIVSDLVRESIANITNAISRLPLALHLPRLYDEPGHTFFDASLLDVEYTDSAFHADVRASLNDSLVAHFEEQPKPFRAQLPPAHQGYMVTLALSLWPLRSSLWTLRQLGLFDVEVSTNALPPALWPAGNPKLGFNASLDPGLVVPPDAPNALTILLPIQLAGRDSLGRRRAERLDWNVTLRPLGPDSPAVGAGSRGGGGGAAADDDEDWSLWATLGGTATFSVGLASCASPHSLRLAAGDDGVARLDFTSRLFTVVSGAADASKALTCEARAVSALIGVPHFAERMLHGFDRTRTIFSSMLVHALPVASAACTDNGDGLEQPPSDFARCLLDGVTPYLDHFEADMRHEMSVWALDDRGTLAGAARGLASALRLTASVLGAAAQHSCVGLIPAGRGGQGGALAPPALSASEAAAPPPPQQAPPRTVSASLECIVGGAQAAIDEHVPIIMNTVLMPPLRAAFMQLLRSPSGEIRCLLDPEGPRTIGDALECMLNATGGLLGFVMPMMRGLAGFGWHSWASSITLDSLMARLLPRAVYRALESYRAALGASMVCLVQEDAVAAPPPSEVLRCLIEASHDLLDVALPVLIEAQTSFAIPDDSPERMDALVDLGNDGLRALGSAGLRTALVCIADGLTRSLTIANSARCLIDALGEGADSAIPTLADALELVLPERVATPMARGEVPATVPGLIASVNSALSEGAAAMNSSQQVLDELLMPHNMPFSLLALTRHISQTMWLFVDEVDFTVNGSLPEWSVLELPRRAAEALRDGSVVRLRTSGADWGLTTIARAGGLAIEWTPPRAINVNSRWSPWALRLEAGKVVPVVLYLVGGVGGPAKRNLKAEFLSLS